GLQRPWFGGPNPEALHLRGERHAALADRLRGATASLGKQIADSLASADQIDRLEHSITAAKGEPLLVEQSTVDTFHCERNGASSADRIDARFVTALRRAQHRGAIANATECTEREEALVLDPHVVVVQFVQVFAPD